MEIRAYNKLYLEDTMKNIGVMLHCGVYDYGLSAKKFYSLFFSSGVARQVEIGNPMYLAGKSGIELADDIMAQVGLATLENRDRTYFISPEYWAGWILTYYQWHSCLSFEYINTHGLDIETVLAMYNPLHEADPEKFTEIADGIITKFKNESPSPIKIARQNMNMTQKELSEATGISLRMIRAYEQKTQSLSTASACNAVALARVLCQKLEDLLYA